MKTAGDQGGRFRIGNINLPGDFLVAPMAGITDPPFRLICYRFGADLCFTEMASSEGISRRSPPSLAYLSRDPAEPYLAVQIFGKNADRMAKAAGIAARSGADLIDINFGCPVKKVTSNGAGAALLKDPDAVFKIASAVKKEVSIPVTAKIRTGWSRGSPTYREIGTALSEAGVDAVIFHPRYRDEGFTGRADWSLIADLVDRLPIPVIGNGDVVSPDDYFRMKSETGCAAVMIGRGILGRPWLASAVKAQIAGLTWRDPRRAEILTVLLDHLRMVTALRGEAAGLTVFRKHLVWYTKGWPGIAHLRPRLMEVVTVKEVEKILWPLTAEEDRDKTKKEPAPDSN